MKVVCANCMSVNRIPDQRRNDVPVCGKCKSRLLPGRPVELNDTTFQPFVARTDVPVLIDFWAPWCGPCRMMAPAFEEAAAQLASEVILAKLNTEIAQRTAGAFEISSIPTLLCFRGGKEVGRQPGAMNRQQIVQWVRALISG